MGSGRKRKTDAQATLHGRRRQYREPVAANAPDDVKPPSWLKPEELTIWQTWAPAALEARTLTSSTAGAFADLCRAVVIRDTLWATIEKDGLTFVSVRVDGAGTEHPELKKHPLLSDHRGWAMRVEAAWARFRLAPVGKEIAVPETEADPFDEFQSQPLTVVAGGKK